MQSPNAGGIFLLTDKHTGAINGVVRINTKSQPVRHGNSERWGKIPSTFAFTQHVEETRMCVFSRVRIEE